MIWCGKLLKILIKFLFWYCLIFFIEIFVFIFFSYYENKKGIRLSMDSLVFCYIF